MASSEHHGARGEMWLKHSWTETSSGHVETYDDLKLESTQNEKSIVLVKTSGVNNFIKSSDSSSTEERYEILADDLVNLIKQHGKRV
ncbi:hypothetical protein [Acidithiobacillus ferrivorans]|uniref:Uncharacterized protein n=1 Tax=Acidithiobacillus ferrivorans TaxID=160808 RepID=A0A7T5BHP6_9PROT|nr:hypothetical protein [Acidithiobacillus ferrivorans]QQD72820.1 hypothetical protein H2515_00240 [Acidithiobacillus ferrivorans]